MPRVPSVTLRDGNKLPQIGFGTYQAEIGEVERAVETAIRAGYRHIDLAKLYKNQQEIGRGIANSGVPREELFLTSKLWNTAHRPQYVAAALDDTLSELNTPYLDLYVVHFPVPFAPGKDPIQDLWPQKDGHVELDDGEDAPTVLDTWRAMLELKKSGKVKSVGVSNFPVEAINAIATAGLELPSVNQIERHPLLPQPDLVSHHATHNIHITAYMPLGGPGAGLLATPTISEIAKKNKASEAQVLLAWGTAGGHSVIPKSFSAARIESNLASLDKVKLDKEDLKAIEELGNSPKRLNVPFKMDPSWDIGIWGDEQEKGAKGVLRY